MSAFEAFLRDNPKMADEPYGAAMAGTSAGRSHARFDGDEVPAEFPALRRTQRETDEISKLDRRSTRVCFWAGE